MRYIILLKFPPPHNLQVPAGQPPLNLPKVCSNRRLQNAGSSLQENFLHRIYGLMQMGTLSHLLSYIPR